MGDVMKNILFNSSKSIFLILSIFTKIPLKLNSEFDEEDYKLGMIFLPIIGLIIGLGFVLIKLTTFVSSSYIVGLLLTIFYVIITGAIHIRGFGSKLNEFFSSEDTEENSINSQDSTGKIIGVLLLLVAYIVLLGENSFSAVFLMPIVGRTSYMLSSYIVNNKNIENSHKLISVSDKSVRNSAFLFAFILSLIFNFMAVIPIFIAFVIIGLFTKMMIDKKENFSTDDHGFMVELSQIIFLIVAYYII